MKRFLAITCSSLAALVLGCVIGDATKSSAYAVPNWDCIHTSLYNGCALGIDS